MKIQLAKEPAISNIDSEGNIKPTEIRDYSPTLEGAIGAGSLPQRGGFGGGEGPDKQSDGSGGYPLLEESLMEELNERGELSWLELIEEKRENENEKDLDRNSAESANFVSEISNWKVKGIPPGYAQLKERLQILIQQMRVVLESIEAKTLEKEWKSGENLGELDDDRVRKLLLLFSFCFQLFIIK